MPDLTGTPSDPGGDDELDQLRALAGRVRPEAVAWETPPADLWDRIAIGAEGIDTEAIDTEGIDTEAIDTDHDALAIAPPGTLDHDATVHPLEPARRDRAQRAGRRPARTWLIAVAAAVVLLLGAGAVVAGLATSDPDTTVLASGPLERLAGDSGEGRAELVDRDGSLQLQVETSGLDAGDGFLEVWVIDPDVTKLISLGPLRSDGRYDLPAGFDAKAFPVVDVSVEPIDGNPAHSGDSRLRGELRF